MGEFVSIGDDVCHVRIPAFRGLHQAEGDHGNDPCYAVDAENAFTRDGTLAPMAKCELAVASLPGKIETLCRLHRRWTTDTVSQDILVAASGGKLYWAYPSLLAWNEIAMPDGLTGYQSNVWSFVSYEINDGESVEEAADPVDVLLLSNAKDGMICVRGDNMTASTVETPKKFGTIARFNERIWGGAIEDDPDMLVYSAPYDPFDWAQNEEIPEDGAGDIQQPSWDGDSFTALAPFGSQLMAFKKNRVWRVLGTNPGEFTFKEQYGGGTEYPQTVVVDKTSIYMLGKSGILCYDGETVSPFHQSYAQGIWWRMNTDKLAESAAVLHKGKLYVAVPLDGSAVNNAVVVYDTETYLFTVRTGIRVESFLSADEKLYFTSSDTPGRVWLWHEDLWREGGRAESMIWVTPWLDFNYKNKVKSGFEMYVTAQATEECEISFSIETEKKKKTKVLKVVPEEGVVEKMKKLKFSGSGRRFRVIVESTGDVPWRIIGGLMMVVETDDD